MSDFLPMSRAEMDERGWDRLDFVCVTGDAYVDHPSFGIALIGRLLEARGWRVGIIAQPDWKSPADFKRLGRPRLAFLVSGGNIDSMVSNYTVALKPRREDAYSPGGAGGKRPDRAAIVYAVRAREAYKGVPIILGGLEASLRRFAHFDYWSNKLRRSILLDAKADLVVFGMGELAIVEIARRLADGVPAGEITDVPGTLYAASAAEADQAAGGRPHLELPAWEEVSADPAAFAESFKQQYRNSDPGGGLVLAESYPGQPRRWVVQNPPARPLTTAELDEVYELPYARRPHPAYDQGVPSILEVRWSLVSSRGCFGSCSFCSLTFHQGRLVAGRSHASLLREAGLLAAEPDFKGYIHDVGGPTANFRGPACARQDKGGACPDRECLFPKPCPALRADHSDYLALLTELRGLPGVKKVFVRSGLRYDYLQADPHGAGFLDVLCEHHVSGQLKVAPEHVSEKVLRLMGKPSRRSYELFKSDFQAANRRLGKEQYLVPYFISSHPGSGLKEAVELAEYFRDQRIAPEQVQDFYPTPGTLATCMYHTGRHPLTGEAVHVPRSYREKAMQRALLQYRLPQNRRLAQEALIAAGRPELIGRGPKCLVPPAGGERRPQLAKKRKGG